MIIYPAIWLRQDLGQDSSPESDERIEPMWSKAVETARRCETMGAQWLYCVNAAQRDTAPILVGKEFLGDTLRFGLSALRVVREATKIPIMFGGKLRSLEDIDRAFNTGAERVVLGSAAVENPIVVADAVDRWGPDGIVVGIHARNSKVVVRHDRTDRLSISAIELGHRLHALGIRHVLYSDENRLGAPERPGIRIVARLGDETGLNVICGGSITTMHEVEMLKSHEHFNIEGIVLCLNPPLGQVDLRAAIEIGKRPLSRRSAGLVPYRRGAAGVEFLLIFNLFFDQWQFPRGGVKAGESEPECARRELREETGLVATQVHDEHRTELQYTAVIRNHLIERTIVYFPAEVGAGEVQLGDENHCEAVWVDGEEACRLLTETSPEQLPALNAALKFLGGRGLS